MDLGDEHLVEPMLCHRENLAALELQRRFARFWVVGATPRSTASCVRERVNLRGTQIVSLALDVEQDDRRTHSPSARSVRIESWRTLIACRRLSSNLGGVRANATTGDGLTAGGDIDNTGASAG